MSDNINNHPIMKHFEAICVIPHGSGDEKAIGEYLVSFAKSHGLSAYMDEAYNVVIKKPCSPGYEEAPVVMLQAHTDMVCEKNEGTGHDFTKDGIKTIIEGDIIRADKTTLGADNGAAVALIMALIEDKTVKHPALEIVLTAGEEVGMTGANAIDTSPFESKILLNLDSDVEGEFLSSCAGGVKVMVELPVSYVDIPKDVSLYTLKLKGLKGGHSGASINEERGNSNRLLSRVLSAVLNEHEVYIAGLSGGDKNNAIPREAEAVIAVNPNNLEAVKSIIHKLQNILKSEYRKSDPGVTIMLEDCNSIYSKVFSKETAEKIISALMAIPNGVVAMSTELEGLVETSCNIGVVTFNNDTVSINCLVRSCVESRKHFVTDQIILIGKALGAKVTPSDDYPSWEYNPSSRLRELLMDTYNEMYGDKGRKAKMGAVHVGLECGLFSNKIPGIDIVSFGPDILDIHTPEERMSISSFLNVWELLKNTLSKIK